VLAALRHLRSKGGVLALPCVTLYGCMLTLYSAVSEPTETVHKAQTVVAVVCGADGAAADKFFSMPCIG
jgi:hypothetical protein